MCTAFEPYEALVYSLVPNYFEIIAMKHKQCMGLSIGVRCPGGRGGGKHFCPKFECKNVKVCLNIIFPELGVGGAPSAHTFMLHLLATYSCVNQV